MEEKARSNMINDFEILLQELRETEDQESINRVLTKFMTCAENWKN